MFGLNFKNSEQPQPKRVTIPTIDDAYTKATALEQLNKEGQKKVENFFTNKDGEKISISKLNGEREELLRQARESVAKEEDDNTSLRNAGPDPDDEYAAFKKN